MGLTQDELAQRMGTRQQTISEWETGMYAPRGLSERMLAMVAEQAGFAYQARNQVPGTEEAGTGSTTNSQPLTTDNREPRSDH
jgi:transcriptional regulator with XRE-family HTH domain